MRPILRLVVIVCSIYLWQDCGNPTATLADITNWQTGQTIPGTEGITPGPGMVLENWNTETHNLRYADFSDGLNLRHSTFSWDWLDSARFAQANLTGVTFWHSTLTDADLSQANLTNARFGTSTLLGANLSHANLTKASFYDVNIGSSATLTGVNLTDATVVGASFWGTTSSGFTAAQLYSTASYQNRDLSGIGLGDNDLTGWNFHGQNLTNAGFYDSTLINANLSQANLTNAGFYDSTLTGADLTNAVVVGTNFGFTTITREQLYSTASYQNRDLLGIRLNENDLTGWNFAGQNLTRAYFGSSTLTDADLTGAVIVGAQFGNTTSRGFTPEQLYSTASYQNRDLSGIGLFGNDLTGWNFAGQNLTRAYFGSSTLTGADLTDATVVRAWFGDTTSRGFTPGQLYSTASYQNHDLSGIILEGNDLTGWNFAGQNLTGAGFRYSTLAGADLADATVVGAWFGNTTSRGFTAAQLYSTASYQNHDLSGIELWDNNLTGWNFVGQNLANANFNGATLTGADLSQANLTDANFNGSTLTGADLTNAVVVGASFGGTTDFTPEQLYSTASYQSHDLSGIRLAGNDLTGWSFAGQNLANTDFSGATLTGADLSWANLANSSFSDGGDWFGNSTLIGADLSQANLSNANFWHCTLTDADLTGAVIVGAQFGNTTSRGFTQGQLTATASYQNHDLSGIGLSVNDLTGWNFAGQNLVNASFYYSTLTGADFSQANLTNTDFTYSTLTGADLTSADTRGTSGALFAGTTLTNTILVDGRMDGLSLGAGQSLVIRDYDGNPVVDRPPIPIHVEQQFVMDAGGMLQVILEADAWDSTISFDAGIPAMLGGTLGLDFAQGVDFGSQIGRTFDLFDWTGVTLSGAFDVASPYSWDLTQLYTSGDVTLLAIPEPTAVVVWLLGILGVALLHRRRSVIDYANHDMAADR